MKTLIQHINEKLVINKDFKKVSGSFDDFMENILAFFDADDFYEVSAITKFIIDNRLEFAMDHNIENIEFYIYSNNDADATKKSDDFGFTVSCGNFNERDYNDPIQIYSSSRNHLTYDVLTDNNGKIILYKWMINDPDLWCLFDTKNVK